MEDTNFKELFQRIVDRYELAPDVAAELLQRILAILKNTEGEPLQSDAKYEILTKYLSLAQGSAGTMGETSHCTSQILH